MRITDEKFRSVLKKIPDSYDDFVYGLPEDITTDEDRQKILDFLKDNPNATSSDVIGFYTDNMMSFEEDEDNHYEYEDDD